MNRNLRTLAKRITVLLLCALLTAFAAAPIAVKADNSSNVKSVRVGWYESPFNSLDEYGRRSGYAYEYQMKVAAYAGWEYTYVTGSWPELLQMLKDGKIDMLSDVSYTEERKDQILFPQLSMGTEEYCIFVAPNNRDITAADYSTLNGKQVGVNKGSIQLDMYKDWAKKYGIDSELIEVTCTEYDAEEMLKSGVLDAYVTLNAYGDPNVMKPVCKIGMSDFYFAVCKDRPDLLTDLNAAMIRIQEENPYYNERMFEKYISRFGTNAYLSRSEEEWLDSHGTIRVGYQDNYLAFCAEDPDTGELIGALDDFLDLAQDCIVDTHIDFEAISYPTASAAFEALKNGEIDCVFPANLSSYESELQNVIMTQSLIRSDIYAVVRASDNNIFTGKEHVIVAVNEGNPNYVAFLQENFPEWRQVCYPTTADCIKAVAENVADCVLISSFRYNNLYKLCKKYHLTTYSTGVGLDYCFAVAGGNNELYSIISKTVGLVPASTVNATLAYYISEDAKVTFLEYIADNVGIVLIVGTAIILVFIFILIRSRRSMNITKKLISATEIDRLTGLYNRDYFFQYADRMYRDDPDVPRDAIVLNIEQFHSINALNGRKFGDQVLRDLGHEIHDIADEFDGIGGRFGADRFDIYCRHIEDYHALFVRIQKKLEMLASNVSVRLRMGVMPWQPKIEPIQLFDRARTACNKARGHYAEHMVIFDDNILERELIDQQLLNDLRRALDNHEFKVYYQPKFDIRPDEPVLAGAEALIRWKHPEMGMIMPDSFIPLFERNGMISEVDKYVWAQAAKQLAEWRKKYGINMSVSVNLSRVDAFDSELESTLDNILAMEGLEHDALDLELTESSYTENAAQLVNVAKKLHRKGYTIEMDDFGTGYSSLNMLSAMPIDVLKMDRTFIWNIEKNDKDKQMVSLIIGIAENLDIPVIAEGVETKSQLSLLKDLGCALVQGYFFSRPVSAVEFEARFLKNKT